MVVISYCSVDNFPDHETDRYLKLLPGDMQHEVKKFRYAQDRKSSLLARLMLYESLAAEGLLYLLGAWTRDSNNKPCLPGWRPFNISHSGGIVLFSMAENVTGIDIEQRMAINYGELIYQFHEREQHFINNAPDALQAFYDIWVKKEAFLKAIGTGIVNRLNEFDCTNKSVEFEGVHWHFHPLSISCPFTSYLCSANSEEKTVIRPFNHGMLKMI